ncbi:hypothetical protein D3C71_1497430 [compost metagenome]
MRCTGRQHRKLWRYQQWCRPHRHQHGRSAPRSEPRLHVHGRHAHWRRYACQYGRDGDASRRYAGHPVRQQHHRHEHVRGHAAQRHGQHHWHRYGSHLGGAQRFGLRQRGRRVWRGGHDAIGGAGRRGASDARGPGRLGLQGLDRLHHPQRQCVRDNRRWRRRDGHGRVRTCAHRDAHAVARWHHDIVRTPASGRRHFDGLRHHPQCGQDDLHTAPRFGYSLYGRAEHGRFSQHVHRQPGQCQLRFHRGVLF